MSKFKEIKDLKDIEKTGENSADLAIKQLRILQALFYRHDVTDNDLFNRTNEIISIMQQASKDIRMNFEDVSAKLTEFMKNGGRAKKNT